MTWRSRSYTVPRIPKLLIYLLTFQKYGSSKVLVVEADYSTVTFHLFVRMEAFAMGDWTPGKWIILGGQCRSQ